MYAEGCELMEKTELRAWIRNKKRAMQPDEIQRKSDLLSEKLFAHPIWKSTHSVYVYLNYNQEVCTQRIILRAIAEGKRVAAPRVVDGEMHFFRLTDPGRVVPGYKGIPEPAADAEAANDAEALVIVPGLAFSKSGQRLGYGGGFYDRFLAQEPAHPTVALCYDFQYFNDLPVQAHDRKIDTVLVAED